MRKIIFYILFLIFTQSILAQEDKLLSLEIKDQNLFEAFKLLEEKASIHFYFEPSWIPENLMNKEYKNVPLNYILEDLLKPTVLNFFILNQNVIITKNNLIYDYLPEGFFGNKEEKKAEINALAFSRDVDYSTISSENLNLETIRIGRQKKNAPGYYILSGYVREEISKDPIANVFIVDQDQNGTATDIDGYYELKLYPGLNTLNITSLGTQNIERRIIIYDNGNYDFTLREKLEQLAEVQINANANKNVKSSNTGEENIDVENIKNIPLVLGERDVMKVATMLPGISTTGEGATGFNVRGGKADQNLILLDDAVMYNPAHFFGLFSAINPFTTGSATVYKGNIPAKYGGRLSSVFNITTKDSDTVNFKGEASLGPVTSSLSMQIPVVKGKSGLIFGVRSTYSDYILNNIDNESLNNSEAFFYDGNIKYNHQINEKNKVSLSGYISNDRFSISSDSIYKYQNRMFTLHYDRRVSDRKNATLILTNSNYNFNIDYENNLENNFESGYQINETNAKLDFQHSLSYRHNLNYGISSKYYQIHPGFIEPSGENSSIASLRLNKERGLESAIWITDNFEISDALQLSGGLRLSSFTALGETEIRNYEPGEPLSDNSVTSTDTYESLEPVKTYFGPEFRISARYFLKPDLSIKGSINNTFQYIHTLSNNVTVAPTDTYRLSGYHLKPQSAFQYNLGLFKNFDNNIIETSIETYFKTSDNVLDFKTGANLNFNEYVETEIIQGQGRSYGVELLLKKKEGKLNGWLGYTYSRSYIKLDGAFRKDNVNNGEYFPSNYDKPHDFNLVVNYKITKRFSFSGNFVYQTGRPITYPVGKLTFEGSEYTLYSDRNQFRIPDYYRLDLSFNLEGNHKLNKIGHSFWNFSVYNVLGRNNPYSVYFVTQDGEVSGRQSSIFAVPVPTISYNFKF